MTLEVTLTAEQCWQPVPGGSGTYVVELARGLADVQGVRATALVAAHRGRDAHDGRVAAPVRRAPLPRRLLYPAWNHLRLPRAEWVVRGSDVVHATTWAVPPTARPLVVTVHDLAFLRSPEHFTTHGNAFFIRALDRVRREADLIVVPSQATADDCLAAGLPRDRVRVVPHGVRILPATSDEVAAFRRQHDLRRDYVMWCGTVEPRKNLPVLLEAYAHAAARGLDADLVLVGPRGWGDATTGLGAGEGTAPGVRYLGRLDDVDLHRAYAGARAFCFPSLWEGFGMPVLEAMAHGVPVVTSRGTSMEEIAAGAALLADPHDPEELAEQLLAACGDAHDDLASTALSRSGQFTWSAAAEATAAVYREAAGG
ncbi:glycosyltransferase family 1 protein [Cellulomonas cellasea]|uniref:glycosyltransferase family 4 protein n=1 Tax=Cellulomonas cellasea TaxID=43670 RepID=UPI0025A3A015|nr:glycosyltransferase family 1 protein [Cellulomonas cellasea]MDM8084689.1 glycosyltransferase family 1 protein [Cellulomonas cellasea]